MARVSKKSYTSNKRQPQQNEGSANRGASKKRAKPAAAITSTQISGSKVTGAGRNKKRSASAGMGRNSRKMS